MLLDLGCLSSLGAADEGAQGTITEVDAAACRASLETLALPVVEVVNAVLPDMLARGEGTILVPGGLSGKHVLPALGGLAPASAALRM